MADTTVKGYKVFNPDWTCRGKQYICPGSFEEDGEISVCSSGMHFCKKAADCFNYYQFAPENHVAEVIAYGKVVEDGDKCCTDKLEIVREVPWTEVLEIVNSGNGNSGCGNSGNWNSGNGNSGNRNSGNGNSGGGNSGSKNIGSGNTGVHNSGSWNSGDCNTGWRNSGNWNIGYYNTGDRNSGNWNTGSWNSGSWNSGDWNSCDFSNGCFNTTAPRICLFNKPSEWTFRDWLESEAYELLKRLARYTSGWVSFDAMSEEEKATHPDAKTTDGYLKELDKSECAISWWRELSDDEKAVIKAIPNFDPVIFKKITGIDVEAEWKRNLFYCGGGISNTSRRGLTTTQTRHTQA